METGEPGGATPVIVILRQKLGHGSATILLQATEETSALDIHLSLLVVTVLVIYKSRLLW